MKRSFLQATLASNMKLGPPPPPPPPPQGAIPKSLEEAVYLATKRAETAMRAANHAARAATGAASAAREGLKLNKKACKKANPPPPSPSQPPANTFLPKMPFAYPAAGGPRGHGGVNAHHLHDQAQGDGDADDGHPKCWHLL